MLTGDSAQLQCSWPGAFHNDLPFLLIDLLQSLAELENSICWKFFSFFSSFQCFKWEDTVDKLSSKVCKC